MSDHAVTYGARAAIRQATGDDLDAVVALGRVAVPVAYEGIVDPDIIELILAKQWTHDAVIPPIRTGRMFVAHDEGGRLVGLASYGLHHGAVTVWRFYVHPDARRGGVGTRLLAAIEERADEIGMPVRLQLTDGNATARDFCLSHGLVEIAREPQMGLPDLVWMAKTS